MPARKDEMEYSSNEMVKHNRNAASSAGEQMGSVHLHLQNVREAVDFVQWVVKVV